MFVSDCSGKQEAIINNHEGGQVGRGFGWCVGLPHTTEKYTVQCTQSPVAVELQPEKDSELRQHKTTYPDWVYVQIDWWKKTFLSALGHELIYSLSRKKSLTKMESVPSLHLTT